MKNLIKKILKESDDLSWIQDVSDEIPPMEQRVRIELSDFLMDFMEDNLDVIDNLNSEDFYVPTPEYVARYTDDEWSQFGLDRWRDGDWKENGEWENGLDYVLSFWEIKDLLEDGCKKWTHIENQTEDYDLEYGSFSDRMIFKRNSDGRYFALGFSGNAHDGIDENEDYLYEIFEKLVKIFV